MNITGSLLVGAWRCWELTLARGWEKGDVLHCGVCAMGGRPAGLAWPGLA